MSILVAAMALLLQAGGPADPPENGDRMVCKNRPVTGSRTEFVKECRSAREWNTRRSDIARGVREHTDRAFTGQPPPRTNAGK